MLRVYIFMLPRKSYLKYNLDDLIKSIKDALFILEVTNQKEKLQEKHQWFCSKKWCRFAMVQKSLEVAHSESWRRAELWKRAEDMRRILLVANETRPAVKVPSGLWDCRSPIISFAVPGDLNALSFSQSMRDLGFDIRAIRYPTVPKGSERLRISVNLVSDRERLLELSLRMVDLWKAFSLQAPTPA